MHVRIQEKHVCILVIKKQLFRILGNKHMFSSRKPVYIHDFRHKIAQP